MGFETLTFWHWLACGAVLMILELFAPGLIFLWLGLAAVVTGIIFWALPGLTLDMQLVVFAVFAVISIITGRAVARSRDRPGDHPTLNQRGAQHLGAIYMLEEATVNGHGKVRIGDTVWSVVLQPHEGDLADGDLVKVSSVDGATLIVESAADMSLRRAAQE